MFRIAIIALTASMILIGSVQPASANENVYKSTVRSTAWVLAGNSMGTGVLIDRKNKLVVTNFHVIEGNEKATIFFPEFRDGRAISDDEYYMNRVDELAIEAEVVASDSQRDIAILKLERVPDHIVEIRIGTQTRPGQNIHSVGNPGASDALWIYTFGKVRQNYYRESALDFGPTQMQVLETDAPINQGDSGGPIVDDEGRLVGISQSLSLDSRLYSYGVDITEITWFVNRYKQSVGRAVLQDRTIATFFASPDSEIAINATAAGDTEPAGIHRFFAPAGGCDKNPDAIGR